MKKTKLLFTVFLISALLLFNGSSFQVYAAGAAFTGPGTVRSGDTITLNLNLSAKGSYGLEGVLSYNSSQVTLVNLSACLPGWKVETNGNKIVAYDDTLSNPAAAGTNVITAVFKVKNISEGSNVSISITDLTATDGTSESNIGTVTYNVTIAPPLSGNASLSSLSVAEAVLSPAFNTDTLNYNIGEVDYSISSLNINAITADNRSSISISGNSLNVGNNTVSITVKAENGTTKTYSINVTRKQDPDYIPSNNARLNSLSLSTGILSPAFSPDITDYVVYLPYETDSFQAVGTAEDTLAAVQGCTLTELTSGQFKADVICTAEDKSQKTYTVTVVIMPEYNGSVPEIEDVKPAETQTTEPETTTAKDTSPQVTTDNSDVTAQIIEKTGFPVILAIILIILALGAGFGGCYLLMKKRIIK